MHKCRIHTRDPTVMSFSCVVGCGRVINSFYEKLMNRLDCPSAVSRVAPARRAAVCGVRAVKSSDDSEKSDECAPGPTPLCLWCDRDRPSASPAREGERVPESAVTRVRLRVTAYRE